MNTNNLIKVHTLTDNSSGYFFKSFDDEKSFVITSKHSICDQRNSCDLYLSNTDGCCRVCPKEFETTDIQLFNDGDTSALHIEKIYYEKAKDLVIVHVTETATNKLVINEKSCSDLYVASGFNSLESGVTNLILDTPRSIGTLIFYNSHSNPTPNLIEKERNFQGISGSVVFTHHEKYPIAKALIIHNESHNDFGAESLDTLNFIEINNFFECKVFDQRLYIPEVQMIKEISQQSLDQVLKTIEDFELTRPALHNEFEEKLNSGRFIQITGLSGTGKSVLLRQIAESKANDLPFLFIKSDQLTGSNNWLEYLSRVGLQSFSISEWLICLEAVGGVPIVFIDGIDRVSENSKPIIEDLIRSIFNNDDLANWKIVTTLRDTGLEPLKVWIGALLKNINIQTINVELLNDDECYALAQKIPSIQQLLFSDSKVKEIIRRPFFTKVVTSLKANNFEPESELELIDAWWKRGGFNETGQSTYNRQDFLKKLSELKSINLSNSVKRREIQPIDALDSLVVDGIIHVNSKSSAVDFTHDIFYEWSLLYLLLEEEQNWLNKIESFGQPPYISRVVELLAQREFIDDQWVSHLANPKFQQLRSQWLRAWIIGPIGHPKFIELSSGYTQTLREKDFDLFNKLLTWFQAEKTKANPIFLQQPDQLQLAIQHPWPSDAFLWRTLLEYVFKLIPNTPHRLYPQILKIFEVWQYVGIHVPSNQMSKMILDVSIDWLLEISQKERANGWGQIVNLKDFKFILINLILVSIQSNRTYTERYLNFLLLENEVSREIYTHIVGASSVISQHHPQLLANLTLKFLLDELPKARIEREERSYQRTNKYYEELLAKPEKERTKEEQSKIDRPALFFHQTPYQQIQSHDWKNLSIKYESKYFYPSSPLKEPFFSLLTHSEDTGLQLIRDLSNHAIEAWKQLCEISEKIPLPTIIEFPWGTHEFWGNEKQYIWKKPVWINNAISSAYMVLENWCFEQLEQGRDFDELIQKITLGHESVAILGVVSVLALNKQVVSNSIFPVVTNFKILELDTYRFQQDLQEPSTTLISLQGESKYQKDIETVRHNYNREGHKLNLEFLLRNYFINPEFRELTKDKLSNFKADLPFNFEREKIDESIIKFLEGRADFYAEYGNAKNYFYQELDENQISFGFNHPHYQKQLESEEHKQLNEFSICSNITYWAEKSLEANIIQNDYSIESIVEFLKNIEDENLFLDPCNGDDDLSTFKKIKQSTFSALATIILVFRTNIKEDDLEWARKIISQVVQLPYRSYEIDCPQALLTFHSKKFLAQALVGEIIQDTMNDLTFNNLLNIIASPSHEISLVALKECFKLFDHYPKLTWSAIYFAFALCKNHLKYRIYRLDKYPEAKQELDQVYENLKNYLKTENDWCALPIPDAPWMELDEETLQSNKERERKIAESYNQWYYDDKDDSKWVKSDTQWDYDFSGKVIHLLPERLLHDTSQTYILDFLKSCLEWTIEKQEPSWLEENQSFDDKDIIYEWNHSLSSALARVVGIFPTEEIKSQFLMPILNLKTDACWELLYPFIENYICRYIYDAQKIPDNALDVLDLCLDRFLKASCFDKKSYRAGQISGFDLPKIAKSLMFVSLDQNAPLASRFVNGDWSEIDIILPVVDKYVRAVGWTEYVIHLFLKLCERSIQNYPSNIYADQILELLSLDEQLNWNEQVYQRISSLIQIFIDKEQSMPIELRQKFLKIIDWLVDHGDRRSSALQQNNFFQKVKSS
ncbi:MULTISPECIES: ATP-binding protein [unclassified Acinetobacter]|uniref:ATP-binding protein n=1 Tax=Acinetobacter TaxID=469 RepID=UPI001F4A4FFD|nr:MULTISPECIES: ATP-binding protein [unclassified Acinetobacter]MCH7351754.1 ATP-binding protein [Acinetobacter sp. NIPH 2023]MCH7359314.1 ATP-binding protein [Acinetobacter sp. NIPH 2024]